MTKTFVALLAFVSLLAAMPMPETGTTPPDAVPFGTVHNVALNWAATEYPGAKLGTAIPYVDENGNTVAWMFHFRTDGKAFPRYDQVAADVQAERQTLTANTDLSRWRSKYSHVLVSARRDRAPVLRFGYGTSEYYAIQTKALARAGQTLGPDARLSRIYFISPCTYLEYENPAGGSVVLSEHFERTWDSRAAFAGYVTQARAELRQQYPGEEEAAAAYEKGRWDHALDSKLSTFSEVYVPNYGLAPFYDWSYGCSPTSGAMVCGYVDRFQHSGRLVQYFYQRRDDVEGENDYQIPNIQYECAIDMHTDTTQGATQLGAIAGGLENVAYDNDYEDWNVTNQIGGASSDWCWATLTSEINAGHAMIWSVTNVGGQGHSLAAFGYRTDKYVYVHNTWYMPAEWWEHSSYGNAHVAAVDPGAGDQHNIRLTYPLGDTLYNHAGAGEVLYVGDTCRITWETGTPGTKVDIDVSTDGGRNWQSAAAAVADSGAYHWYIPPSIPSCDSVRLRLSQYNGSTLTSADGSFGCFHTLREALPPPQVAPPNGLPIQDGQPVVLVVDSVKAACDSIHFKLVQGVDTLLQQNGPSAHCVLPDSLLQHKTYKWIVCGRNQWGWGAWSTPWSFRIVPAGVEEEKPAPVVSVFSAPAVNRLASGSMQFDARMAAPGSKLVVYDALGNVIRELVVAQPGRLAWDMTDATGRKLAAGLYFARLAGGATQPTAKLVLLD